MNPAWRAGPLAALLDPISPEEFAATYWGRRPLLVRGGKDKLARMLPRPLSLATLRAELARAAVKPTVFAYTELDGVITQIPADPALSKVLGDLGLTQYVANFTDVFPDFDAWGASLRRQLGHPGEFGVTTFFGGDRGTLSLHFDAFSVFSVQCDGRKRWFHGEEPAIEAPLSAIGGPGDLARRAAFGRGHPWSLVHVPSRAEMVEVVVGPGDLLYVPAGTWHATESEGGPSLSLSYSVHRAGFDELLGRYLHRALDGIPWRQGLPPSTFEMDGDPASASSSALRRFVRDRLKEAGDAIARATPDAVLAAIFESVSEASEGRAEAEAAAIDPDDMIALNPAPGGVITTRIEAGETSVFVHHGGVEIELPGFTAPFFHALAAKKRIRAGDAPSLFPGSHGARWDDVKPLLSLLLTHAIVVRSSAARPPRRQRNRRT